MCEKCLEAQFDAEAVYEKQVEPLLRQAREICREHGMPMVATCCYRRTVDHAMGGVCAVHTFCNRAEKGRTPHQMSLALAALNNDIEGVMTAGALILMKNEASQTNQTKH